MKTLEQQISDECVHFTGIMSKVCKAGVEYDSFGTVKFNVIPCIKGGSASCDKCRYPSPEEVKEEIERINKGSVRAIKVMIAVKDHVKKTGTKSGEITCPHGDHKLSYAIAYNGHARIVCKVCEISMQE